MTLPYLLSEKASVEIRSRYEDHEALLTDGFKNEERAGASVYTNAETETCRLLGSTKCTMTERFSLWGPSDFRLISSDDSQIRQEHYHDVMINQKVKPSLSYPHIMHGDTETLL